MAEKHRIRTIKFSFTLLPEESALLQKNAFELNLSKADYVRNLIVFGSLIDNHPIIDNEQGMQILNELKKVGSSLNQIAYSTNIKHLANEDDWNKVKKNYLDFLTIFTKVPLLSECEQNLLKETILDQLDGI